MIKKFTFAALILLLSLPLTNAQTVIAKYAGEFMAIGVGGRPLAMGGAFAAVANDITAGYYNPAGLALINYPQVSLMHDERFGNLVNYDYGAVAIPWDTDMSFSLSVMRLGIDGIPDTRQALEDGRNPGVTVTDPSFINDQYARLNYSKITEFSDQEWAFYLSFAKKQAEDFYYGASIKIIRKDIAEFGATGVGFDVGAIYLPFENFSVGANLQDITTTLIAWDTGLNELISPTAKLGAAYGLDILNGRFTPALDFDVRFENRQYASTFHAGPVSFDMHAGFEFNYNNLFSIRAGYNDVKQFTVGAGIKLPKLNIDYSFARFNMAEIDRLPDTHRISIILTLEEPRFLRTGM
jgi:hypothetical protein